MTYAKLPVNHLCKLDRLLSPYGFSSHTQPLRSLYKYGARPWLTAIKMSVSKASPTLGCEKLMPTQELAVACFAANSAHNGRFSNTRLKWFDKQAYYNEGVYIDSWGRVRHIQSYWVKFVDWQVLLNCMRPSTLIRWHGAVADILQARGDI